MKKKSLKSLRLNKKSISSLANQIKGGDFVDASSDPNTFVKACSNHMCDSRLGGCPSYYCLSD